MKSKYKNFFLSLFFFALLHASYLRLEAQIIPASTNISYLLNTSADLYFSHKIITRLDKKWVVLVVEVRNNIAFDSLDFAFSFTKSLSTPLNDFRALNLSEFEFQKTNEQKVFALDVSKENINFFVLIAKNRNTEEAFTYIINLNRVSNFFITKASLTIPIINGYANKLEGLKIANLDGELSNYGALFYSAQFSPSLPPMANLKTVNPFEKPDTTYQILSTDTLPSKRVGVYSIFEASNEKKISFFRIENKRYPLVSSINELIEASIFLLTRDEKTKLENSFEPKKEYDAFWLENTNSSERAGKMISAYFSRVMQANSLFTSYKQGWKTDMGMIYIIFGPPDKVFKTDFTVQWAYDKTYELPNLVFKFYEKNKDLDTEYFELERDIKYQNTWFRAIDLWRKGKKSL